MASIAEVFQAGLNFYKSGNLQQAEQSFRQVLQADPRHTGAMHSLGLIALQVGDGQAAVEWLSAVIRVDGTQPLVHAHLADAYRNLGQLSQAAAAYRQAIGLAPDFVEAHEALGTVLKMHGDLPGAAASYREAIRLRPGFAVAHYNLGVVLKALGQVEDARACYHAALLHQPTLAEAHLNLACLFHEARDFSAAAAEYQEAMRLKPDFVDAIDNYGLLVQSQGRLDEALECFERVIQLRPNWAIGHLNRANVFKQKDMRREAIAGYLETLRLDPNYATAYHNLAVAYNEVQQPDPAVEYCQRGLSLDPTSALLCDNLAFAMHTQGRGDEAISWYRKSVSLAPDSAMLHANLLYSLNYIPGVEPAALFAEHLDWARRHAEPLTALARPHANDRTSDRRLRIGYVSACFCQHAVNYFTEPMITAHDHAGFEIFCYSDVMASDAITARLNSAADAWRDVSRKTDDELDQLVRDDRIDILVDLAGHIGGNRLLVFARKPAPVQVTYIGYQNTTGMSAMDYRFTDLRADPPGMTDAFYTEELVRLPRSFFCYRPPDGVPAITPLPASKPGQITFGAFNAFRKTTPDVITAWMRILKRLSESRLLVLASCGGYVERRLREMAAEFGVDPRRVKLFDRRSIPEYMEFVQQADIALDTFPFTGHTTTCDACWMGVPVVMLEGNTYASRFGGSVLANLGLENLIARSVDEYVEIAVELATDLDGLAQLRAELRPRMAASALLDFQGFTRNVEAAYRRMWLKYCSQGR
jgi:predicted O-linked N-acetylglucosamine transferase (SPINDLY family)